MGLKKTEQKEYAKFLFTEKSFTQKQIAEKVGITEKTLRNWINENEGEWKKIKKITDGNQSDTNQELLQPTGKP